MMLRLKAAVAPLPETVIAGERLLCWTKVQFESRTPMGIFNATKLGKREVATGQQGVSTGTFAGAVLSGHESHP